MEKRLQSGWLFLGAAFFCLALVACGGGGGGSSSPSLDNQAYTGVRTQATFSLANAEDLVLGAIEGQSVSRVTPLSYASTLNEKRLDQVGISPSGLVSLARHAATQSRATLPQVGLSALLNPAEECLNYPVGTLTDTLVESIGASTATVSGTITYTNCDIGGLILTGPEIVSATINLATNDIGMAITFQNLHADDGVEAFTLAGSMNGSFFIEQGTGLPATELTMNVTVTDATNKSFWLNNYQLDEWEEATGIRGRWSGRFYHHDHGFVDFVTDPADPIFIPFDTLAPTYDGKLDFTGVPQSHATLWLGVNATDYCINVFGSTGAHLGDLGTCAP